MVRITDAERGARIARDQAQAVLDAASPKNDLFPLRLGRHERRLWEGILFAAEAQLVEEVCMRIEAWRHLPVQERGA